MGALGRTTSSIHSHLVSGRDACLLALWHLREWKIVFAGESSWKEMKFLAAFSASSETFSAVRSPHYQCLSFFHSKRERTQTKSFGAQNFSFTRCCCRLLGCKLMFLFFPFSPFHSLWNASCSEGLMNSGMIFAFSHNETAELRTSGERGNCKTKHSWKFFGEKKPTRSRSAHEEHNLRLNTSSLINKFRSISLPEIIWGRQHCFDKQFERLSVTLEPRCVLILDNARWASK